MVDGLPVKNNLQQGITRLALRWGAQLYVLIRYESQDLFTDLSNAKGGLSFGCWLRPIQGYLNPIKQFICFLLVSSVGNNWNT